MLACNDRLRIFFGLAELDQVGAATVTIEGRSYATSGNVGFEVWNPGASVDNGALATMSNDWDADIVDVSFVAEAGNDFQAVEIAPVSGSCSMAIRRVRLTLSGL